MSEATTIEQDELFESDFKGVRPNAGKLARKPLFLL